MNFWSIARLALGVFWIAGSAGAEVTLRVRVYDFAKIGAKDLERALEVSSRILGAAGVHVVWERGEEGAAEGHEMDQSSAGARSIQSLDNRSYLAVRLLRGVPATIAPRALGFAVPSAQHGVHATLFCDRIETVGRSVPPGPLTVLGASLAHEIGHVLLGSGQHSPGGIMKAVWTDSEYRHLAARQLDFQANEAMALREEAVRRERRWEQASAIDRQ